MRHHTENQEGAINLSTLLCLDLVGFPVLCPIKPQAPLLVVPFRQFLYVSALRPYSSQKPKTLIAHEVLKET